MASALKNLSSYDEKTIPSAENKSFGIVVAEWNAAITHALYEGCFDKAENIHTIQVPGSFELPTGARLMAVKYKLDAVICLGCVIKGETKHDEYISNAVAMGLINLSLDSGQPFIFGVLTPNNEEQARDRAGGKHGNKGVEAAVSAIRMAALRKDMTGKTKIGF